MWARYIEGLIALWIVSAPAVLRGVDISAGTWLWQGAIAGIIVLCALASHAARFRYAHLISAGIGLGLTGFGLVTGLMNENGTIMAQHQITTGLLLSMLGIVPSRANRPPTAWRDFYETNG